jgi:ACS family hexuronate transporter-like MFS transporter
MDYSLANHQQKISKDHPWVTEEEKEYILSGQPENKTTNDKAKTWSNY